jgi:hypothetical protein
MQSKWSGLIAHSGTTARLLGPLLLTALIHSAVSLEAAVLTVTSLADSGPGTLREEITLASPGDTIQFGVTGVIGLLSSINIPYSLNVQGPGPSLLIVDAGNHDRAFITAGAPVIISGMTIRNGLVMGINGPDGGPGEDGIGGGDAVGGAILDTNSASDVLILSNCWLNANAAIGGAGGNGGANAPNVVNPGDGAGGGSAEAGAVKCLGINYNYNCTFSHNAAIAGNGGNGGDNLYHAGVAGGYGGAGGISLGGALGYGHYCYNYNCTFSGNTAAGGAGGQGGGYGASVAPGPGGKGGLGGNGEGGAIAVNFTTYYDCTIVSNSASGGAGGSGGSGLPPGANGASGYGAGGAIYQYVIACAQPIGNTIIADNYADIYTNYLAAFEDEGYNFIGSDDYSICPWGTTTQAGTVAAPIHPKLGPLAQNGGGLPTHATTLSSPVTDQGYSFGLTTDERGAPRPYRWGISEPPGGDGSDIGAYELGSAELAATMGGNGLVLSWPACYGDFTLQSDPALTTKWSDVVTTPVVVGNRLVVTNQPANPFGLYRLVVH